MGNEIKYFIFIFVSAILYSQVFFLNRFSNNGIYFGVRVPLEYINDSKIKLLEKNYKKDNVIFIMPVIIALNIMYISNPKVWSLLLYTLILLAVSNILPVIYWKRMKCLKEEKGWKSLSKNVVVVETNLRQPKKSLKNKGLSSGWYLSLMVIPIIMLILTFICYRNLPEYITVHYNSSGIADKIVKKGTFDAYFNLIIIPVISGIMVLIFTFINRITVNSKSDLFSGKIKGTIEKKLLFKRYVSIFTWILSLETLIIISMSQISILLNLKPDIMNIPVIVMLITLVVFIIFSYRFGQGGRNIKTNEEGEENYRDDDDRYILGAFYCNKKDPCLMVEKRIGVGWTVNIAHPIGKVLMVIPFIIIIAMIIFMYFFERLC